MKLDATLLDHEVLVGRVVASVREVSGLPVTRITLDARLREDLGLDRDRGYALMESLHDQFEMDWTGFDLDAHFGAGGQSLTVSGLADALRQGRWPDGSSPRRRIPLVALAVGLALIVGPILVGGCAK